jgi:hypothetical protein
VTGARLYLQKSAPTLIAAAECCGSNVRYVRAAVALCNSENATLLDDVLAGRTPLLQAAAQAKPAADLVVAYRRAGPQDLIDLCRAVGADTIFTNMIEPAIG